MSVHEGNMKEPKTRSGTQVAIFVLKCIKPANPTRIFRARPLNFRKPEIPSQQPLASKHVLKGLLLKLHEPRSKTL